MASARVLQEFGRIAFSDIRELLPREQLALRTVSVLTGLEADKGAGGRNVSISLAKELDASHPLAKALLKNNSLFVEPLQVCIVAWVKRFGISANFKSF